MSIEFLNECLIFMFIFCLEYNENKQSNNYLTSAFKCHPMYMIRESRRSLLGILVCIHQLKS